MWWSFYQLSCLQKAASIFISFPKPTLGSFLLGFLEVISGDGGVRVEAGGGGGGGAGGGGGGGGGGGKKRTFVFVYILAKFATNSFT